MTEDSLIQHLVERAQGGSREAFDILVEEFQPRLARQVRARLGAGVRSRLEPEDVLQETFTRAFQSISTFRWQGESALYAWFAGIAEHVIWTASQKKSPARLTLKGAPPAEAVSPSKHLRRKERFERLEDAIRDLSPDERTALTLSRFAGLKVGAIAARMGRSPKAVYKLLARAVLRLKESFGDTESLHLPHRALKAEEEDDAD